MRNRAVVAAVTCIVLQAFPAAAAVANTLTDAVRVQFSVTAPPPQASSPAIRNAVAAAAGVPATAVAAAKPGNGTAATATASGSTGVAFTVTVVNLAAPYAMLIATDAADKLAVALRRSGALFVKSSLLVEAPQWVVDTQAAAAVGGVTLDFVMSGVPLPSINQFSLRAAIATVAGVQLDQVSIVSVAYAVRASGRRMLAAAGGYDTLRVIADVNAEAAGAAGMLVRADVGRTLREQLLTVLGAEYQQGSLRIAAASPVVSGARTSGSRRRHYVVLACVAAAAAALAVAAAVAAAVLVVWRRRVQLVESDVPVGKEVDEDAACPQAILTATDIAGARPAVIQK